MAGVHAASFGSEWTPELYRQVMESPGYRPEEELVVEAPDGALAAFTKIWYDRRNRTGLFEPVGTHKNHRRRGLGRAVVLYGMRLMASEGMVRAQVVNECENEASRALYCDCGFHPLHELIEFVKAVPGTAPDENGVN